MRFILPVLLALIGLGGGVGAALFMAPKEPAAADVALECTCPPVDANAPEQPRPIAKLAPPGGEENEDPAFDYVKLNNQFVVPVVKEGRVAALVAMSLSVEVKAGGREAVFTREPKLRDTFLQVLFEHANAGGFDGNFTTHTNMATLRRSLVLSARTILGDSVTDILIQDIARQDS